MHLAGDVELELPEGTPDFNADKNRIRPSAGEPDQEAWASSSRRVSTEGGILPTIVEAGSRDSITLADGADQLALAQQHQQKGLQVRTAGVRRCQCRVVHAEPSPLQSLYPSNSKHVQQGYALLRKCADTVDRY